MIWEILAYPVGKLFGIGMKWFENREERLKIKLEEEVKDNDHRRDLEMMNKQSEIQQSLENIKAKGKLDISKEETSQREIEYLESIAKVDSDTRNKIIKNQVGWMVHAASALRLAIGIFAGVVFYSVGSYCSYILLDLIKNNNSTIDPSVLKKLLEIFNAFFHTTTSLVLMYVGITHSNLRFKK